MAFALDGPALIEVQQGKTATAVFRILATSKPYRNVTLSVSGAQAGMAASFSSLSGKPSFQSTLQVTASLSLAVGSYQLTIRARDAKSSKTMSMFVNVGQAEPRNPPSGCDIRGLGCPVGFGAATTGGFGGTDSVVTNLNNSGAGSLRSFLEDTTTRWITFSVSGTINLTSEIVVRSNKTIDGRGQNIRIAGTVGQGALFLGRSGGSDPTIRQNIIIHNVTMDVVSQAVGRIVVGANALNIWLDHITFETDAGDNEGLQISSDATGDAPYNITVSWCKFQSTIALDHGAFLGCVDPAFTQNVDGTITMHHNYFNTHVRQPLYRHQTIHSFNNYRDGTGITDWIGVQCSIGGSFLSENDIYKQTSGNASVWHVTTEGGNANAIKVVNPWSETGTEEYEEFNTAGIFTPPYSYSLATADATLKAAIIAGAGAH